MTDAYAPAQVAALVEEGGVRKAGMPLRRLLVLGMLGGAFIAFGAMFFTVTITGSTLGLGPTRLLGGIAFSLGLILVAVGGAELFTGNCLIVMARARTLQCMVEVARMDEQIGDPEHHHETATRLAAAAVDLASQTQNRRLAARAWAIPPSVRNAKPSSWRSKPCASWPRKPMVKP